MSEQDRIAQLERENEENRRDIAFLARHIPLHEKGAASATEYARAREIAERYER